MSQFDFGTIVATTKSGAVLADDLNSWRTALHSSHKGSTAPSYKVAGMFWLDDTTAANHLLKYYDGTDWATVLSIDTTNNRASIVTVAERMSFPTAGGTANALTLTPAVALTAPFDLDVVTFEAAASNTGAATLDVSSTGAKAIRKMSNGADVAVVAGDIVDGNRYYLNYDTAANSAAGAWILVNPSAPIAIRGYLSGGSRANHLENDTLDPTNDIVVKGGECASVSATPLLMVQPADLIKRLDAAWAAGNNQGMLDQGTLANATYHIHRIMRPDTGVADIIASLSHDEGAIVTMTIASPCVVTWGVAGRGHGLVAGSTFKFLTSGALPTGVTAGTTYYVIATGLTETTFRFAATNGGAAINTSGSQSGLHFGQATPLLPANYSDYRRLGSIRRVSGAILPFVQVENYFYTDVVQDVANSAAFGQFPVNLSVPLGIIVQPLLVVELSQNAAGSFIYYLTPPARLTAKYAAVRTAFASQLDMVTEVGPHTNAGAQIYHELVSSGGTLFGAKISTGGWIDTRGRFA